jgi:hypothetical protein
VPDILDKSKSLVVAALFAVCVAPTFISYRPYRFGWDDSDYLVRSIAVSRAFWSGNIHGLGAMVSIRPPAMTLLGLPWRALASGDAAGKCFLTLAVAISLLAALCLYLLMCIGVRRVLLVAAAMCVLASLGPYPSGASAHGPYPPGAAAHWAATAFLADSLFAWTTLAAVLLIPYEARTHCLSLGTAVVRGILWGSILSLGAMTKVNFLYFVVLLVPILFLIRLHNVGLRGALAALAACACWSAPSAFYLARWGRPAFDNAKASSFGRVASFYYVPFVQFLGQTTRESPGLVLSFALTVTVLIYLMTRRRRVLLELDVLPLLIMIGFGTIVLAATNRQIRYAFPAIVALPFLTAILMSGKEHSAPRQSAALAAGLVLCGLLVASAPTRYRATRETFSRPDAVLTSIADCKTKRIVLATDSPTLNQRLMDLAIAVSASDTSVRVTTLAYHAMSDLPIQTDLQEISESDLVVFQDRDASFPSFTNQRVPDYERFLQQNGYVPVRLGADLSVYSIGCRL